MINLLWKSAIGLGVAGTLALAIATPSLARVKNVDPGYGYGYGGLYGGYYDPWYDPWYGAYPGYSGGSQTTYNDEGGLRLKIKPKNAEVYVDGYFTGTVDEFDGMFQKLHLDSGVHRIEVRAAGFETLTFEVRISADHTTTYQGEMRRIQ